MAETPREVAIVRVDLISIDLERKMNKPVSPGPRSRKPVWDQETPADAEVKQGSWSRIVNDSGLQRRILFFVTVIGIPLVIIGLAINFWGTRTSVRNSNYATRPYVGPMGTSPRFCKATELDCITTTLEQADDMFVYSHFKNFGTLPGFNVFIDAHVSLDNVETKMETKDVPSTVSAAQEFGIVGTVGTAEFQNVIRGRKKLLLRFIVSYDWPGGNEQRCYEAEYKPVIQVFTADRPCPKPPDAQGGQ